MGSDTQVSSYLAGRVVGFLVAPTGVEERELEGPRQAVDEAGGRTVIISTAPGDVTATHEGRPSATFPVDQVVGDVPAPVLDALVLPDGLANSLALRRQQSVATFVSDVAAAGKPVGAFGHAIWSLLDAGLLPGRDVTSHPTIRRDIESVGGRWHDHRVVIDGNLITSRHSDDIEAFNVQLIAFLD